MNHSLADVRKALSAQDNYLILTHRRPDGDTVGSAAALCGLLRKMGKTAYVANSGEFTPRYLELVGEMLPPADFTPRGIISVDIADENLLPKPLMQYKGKVDIAIDHHPSNNGFAVTNYTDPLAAATGEIILRLFRELGATPDKNDYTAIYVAVLTDTGCFRFGNTTPFTHQTAAECMSAGIDFLRYNHIFITRKSIARFKVEQEIYHNAVFVEGGTIAGAYLTRELINNAGADEDDLDNLASVLMSLENVASAVLVTETAPGECKVSVRCQDPMNASHICAGFGGGGHKNAAGCTVMQDVLLARDSVMAAAVEERRKNGV